MGESSVAPRLIEQAQRDHIFAMVDELGFSRGERQAETKEVVGKDSLSASAVPPVTYLEACKLVSHFGRLVSAHRKERGKQHRRRNAKDKSPVSSDHLAEIERLGGKIYGRDDEGQRKFRTWIRNKWKVDDARFLKPGNASSCLQALHEMDQRGWKPNKEGV